MGERPMDWLPPARTLTMAKARKEPATKVCAALGQNQTWGPSVRRPMLYPLNHTNEVPIFLYLGLYLQHLQQCSTHSKCSVNIGE